MIGTVSATDANDISVNDSFDSIQNLIDESSAGDSVYLDGKTYVGNGSAIKINKDISIYGSNTSKTILNANYNSNILVISKNVNVNLFGLTFINGKTTKNGGAIDNAGNLVISGCCFTGNTAYNYDKGRVNGDGGAINNDGTLVISNSEFLNSYSYNGGAIRGQKNSLITATNCSFLDNAATYGASIDAYFANSKIINCTFINSKSHKAGQSTIDSANFCLLILFLSTILQHVVVESITIEDI